MQLLSMWPSDCGHRQRHRLYLTPLVVMQVKPGKGHWVDEVSSNGAIITLEDNSMWEIASLDRIDTSLWLPTTDITVMRDPRPVDDFKYILVNTEDGEKAHAK